MVERRNARTFKTARFSRLARKAGVDDDALCDAIREVMKGQAIDLGGGVFKKRLDKNRSRSIILAKGGRSWVYAHLFAKKDQDNISSRELEGFRALARIYADLTEREIAQLLDVGELKEICHGRET
jgi:hypothetical protein